MKDFKKLIKESHLGNPLNEVDRATNVDRIFAGKDDPENDKRSERYDDVRADLEGEMNELDENEKYDHIARAEYGKPWTLLSIAQKQEMLSYMNRETEKQFQTDYEKRRRGDYSDDREDGMTDYQRRRMDEGFKKGDKVTYLGNPGEITFVGKDQMDRTYYSVAYDKGRGRTKASNLYNKGGEIKAVNEDMNDPVLVKARAAQMSVEKEKAKQAEMDKKYGSNFMDKLDAEIGLKQELQNLKDEREDVLMRIEDIGVEMEQTAEPEGGPIADELGGRLMTAEKELRAINSKMIDIKDDLGYFRMYESDLDEDNTLNINDPGNDSRALDNEVDRMFESESLQESLRKNLKKRLS